MALITNVSGKLSISGIHDSQLSQISVDYLKKEANLRIISPSNILTKIDIKNINILNISDLWDDVIIDSIYLWPFDKTPEEFIYDYDAGWRHLLRGRIDEKEKIISYIEKLKIKKQKAILLSLTSSYGGGFSLLAEHIHISQEQG